MIAIVMNVPPDGHRNTFRELVTSASMAVAMDDLAVHAIDSVTFPGIIE